jgi:kynureninase
MAETELDRARALDAADPLAAFRDRFAIPDSTVVYFDGNSLGRPPKAALEAMARTGEQWAEALIRGWEFEGWLE